LSITKHLKKNHEKESPVQAAKDETDKIAAGRMWDHIRNKGDRRTSGKY
jgi:hypothetical protein